LKTVEVPVNNPCSEKGQESVCAWLLGSEVITAL